MRVRKAVRGKGGGRFVRVCRQRRESVVDAGLIPALQTPHQSGTLSLTPPSPSSPSCIILTWFQFRLTPAPTPYCSFNACTQTHTHAPLSLCRALRGEGSFFSTCTSQRLLCLLPEAPGTPGPEIPLPLSPYPLSSYLPAALSLLDLIQ